MTPQRRTALVSVVAAGVLIVVKLSLGLATGSLGLISEAIHSGTDLVAALLTFFAVGVAGRPADRSHPYGHGKAEHLSALGEAVLLVGASLFIAYKAIDRLVSSEHPEVDAAWYAMAVLVAVIAIDVSRALISWRASRRYGSAALAASAMHFASDLAGSVAVLIGLVCVRAGFEQGDSIAALLVALLVLGAAGHLVRQNVDVLMDRTNADAHELARSAIAELGPSVLVRRLRMRESAGRHFADVVIAVPPGAAVAQGHALADQVEAAVERALPGADVVVHVEPEGHGAALREQALAAALRVPRVREIHNVNVVELADRTVVSLHLKLPGELSLEEAHEVASSVEAAILEAVPAIEEVQTHLEPLAEPAAGSAPRPAAVAHARAEIVAIIRAATGQEPRELRFLETSEGLVAFLTLGLAPESTLAAAHAQASEVEERIRRERTDIADVIVHTEP